MTSSSHDFLGPFVLFDSSFKNYYKNGIFSPSGELNIGYGGMQQQQQQHKILQLDQFFLPFKGYREKRKIFLVLADLVNKLGDYFHYRVALLSLHGLKWLGCNVFEWVVAEVFDRIQNKT